MDFFLPPVGDSTIHFAAETVQHCTSQDVSSSLDTLGCAWARAALTSFRGCGTSGTVDTFSY